MIIYDGYNTNIKVEETGYTPFYVDINRIYPGQTRYSELNVQDKIKAYLENGNISWSCYKCKLKGCQSRGCTKGKYILKYNNDTSTLPLDQALPVIIGPEGKYYLVDGHHDVIASRRVGATTIPVKIIDTLEGEKNFIEVAISKNYIYPYDINGNLVPLPKSFDAMVDDPNRYFAAISARKCESSSTRVEDSTGSEYPLWIKVGKDIPFIEFMIANKLYKYGLIYNPNYSQENLVEEAREILKEDKIQGLRLVEERTYYKDIPNLCSISA